MIVFEIELAYESYPETVLVGHFYNKDIKVHAWSQMEGIGHYK